MNKTIHSLKNFWKKLGPGFITGSSDDDPSGVATYASSGAQFGYSQIWTVWFTTPLMIAVQEMAARIGMVTGRGVIAAVRNRVPRPILHSVVWLLVLANTVNIGADIGAMADAARLIAPKIPFAVLALVFTASSMILEVFVSYKTYARYLKWLTISLFAYIAAAFVIKVPWGVVGAAFVFPEFSFTRESVLMLTAILGTTISPYLMFWQSSEEVEEEIAAGRETIEQRIGATHREVRDMRTDVSFGMVLSNVIMFFIITTTAAVLFGTGATLNTAADVAAALRPLAGDFAETLYAIGIIGVGMLAIPVLAGSASYAVSELYGWNASLSNKWYDAHGFYGVITISTLLGLMINFVGLSPVKALVWSAVVNGWVAPFVIALLMVAANDETLMGKWKNGIASNALSGATIVCMVAIIVFTIIL